jgi:mono/diheme cytochrome c family protein
LHRFPHGLWVALLAGLLWSTGCGAPGVPRSHPGAPAVRTGRAALHKAAHHASRLKAKGEHVERQMRRTARQTGAGGKAGSHPSKAKGSQHGKGSGKGNRAHRHRSASSQAAGAVAPAPAITPAMAPAGATLYRTQGCGGCHGPQGQGTSAAPALNGTSSVPVLSTYPTPQSLATFIHHNMPLTHPGTLTATQADELAAYIYYTLNHGRPPKTSSSRP